MRGPSHTLLLISRHGSARIDLAGTWRLSVQNIWTQAGFDYESLETEVESAIQLGPRRLGRVTILSPDFWTEVLSIPADVVAMATEQEILPALALEAEVDSGLSAFDSRIGAIRLATHSREECFWCVTQVGTAQLHGLACAVRNAGGRLHGVASPLMAPLVLSESKTIEQTHEWIRQGRDRAEVSEEVLRELASDWASCLLLKPRCSMLLLDDAPARSSVQPKTLSAALAILTAAGCGFWNWQTQLELATATREIATREKRLSQQDAAETALKSLETRLVTLRQEVDKAQQLRQMTERQLHLAGATHAQQNQRWMALVDGLAESGSDECWVQKIESTAVQSVVHGLALNNAAANSFAGRLELTLQETGWKTAPAATEVSEHNLVAFKIQLTARLSPAQPAVNSDITQNAPGTHTETACVAAWTGRLSP